MLPHQMASPERSSANTCSSFHAGPSAPSGCCGKLGAATSRQVRPASSLACSLAPKWPRLSPASMWPEASGGSSMVTGSATKLRFSTCQLPWRRRSSKRPLRVAAQARSVLISTSGECLQDMDTAVGPQRVAQAAQVARPLAVDEDDHVDAQMALLVEDVAPQPGLLGKGSVERFAQRGRL